MRVFRSVRLVLLALLVCLIPASSYAGVFISVAIAPPILPVYEQPPCPEPGWMWIPGYWAYGDNGYYWVPGTWAPAPYVGALWTPGYWGWSAGLYMWHPGYWGPHVGYYGGVNYGFGYMGVGFVGGMWAGNVFRYNTAVMRVNTNVIHNTYVDRTIVQRNTIVNDRHVAFSGGPGGINHAPTPDENRFSREQHMAATSYQAQHQMQAMHNVNNFASHNGGHPSNPAMDRPMGYNRSNSMDRGMQAPRGNNSGTPQNMTDRGLQSPHGNSGTPQSHPQPQNHPAPQNNSGQQHGSQPHNNEQHGNHEHQH